jgi:hypothetical protein
MRLKRVLAIAVLLAVSANRPCFAKDGHAQHGARTSAANNGTSGKGASGANPPANKANVSIDAGETVAPPVLPPHVQQQMRTSNPSVKIVIPTNSSRGQAGANTAPTARNAIGQPIVSPRNFVGARPPVLPALQAPGAVSLRIVHGAPGGSAAPPVPLGTAPINVANAPNRGSINGATVVRPATAPSLIGGPAAARYGINGTTVQSKH